MQAAPHHPRPRFAGQLRILTPTPAAIMRPTIPPSRRDLSEQTRPQPAASRLASPTPGSAGRDGSGIRRAPGDHPALAAPRVAQHREARFPRGGFMDFAGAPCCCGGEVAAAAAEAGLCSEYCRSPGGSDPRQGTQDILSIGAKAKPAFLLVRGLGEQSRKKESGAGCRIRTDDLPLTRRVLYQLS